MENDLDDHWAAAKAAIVQEVRFKGELVVKQRISKNNNNWWGQTEAGISVGNFLSLLIDL